MTDKNTFPLCTAAGLKLQPYHVFLAADVERMLAEAPVVYGKPINSPPGRSWIELPIERVHGIPTQTARLVCIEPLKPADTAEGLLREMVAAWDDPSRELQVRDFIDRRARALLEGEK